MTVEAEVDLVYLNQLLVERLKVKRRPVAITYCSDGPPPGYEPVNIVACAIVREAEEGRRVYVDAQHHDCWVGQYHLLSGRFLNQLEILFHLFSGILLYIDRKTHFLKPGF